MERPNEPFEHFQPMLGERMNGIWYLWNAARLGFNYAFFLNEIR